MFHKLNMTNFHKSLDFYFPDIPPVSVAFHDIFFLQKYVLCRIAPLVLPATFFLPLQCIMIKLQFKI